MKKLVFLILCLNFVIVFAQIDKMPNIPTFDNCIMETNVSTHYQSHTKEFNWFSYDLSKEISCNLKGEFWNMYYKNQGDTKSLVYSLKEKISNNNGKILLDIKNNFMFLYPDNNNNQYIVSLDFFNTNFRAKVLNFTTDQLNELTKNDETPETVFFTDKIVPLMTFYYDQKMFQFMNKYKNDLNDLIALVKKNKKNKLYFFSYADLSEGGFVEANKISKNRLLIIKKRLNNAGIRNHQIVSINRGVNQVYDKNLNGKESWKNRRIEFFIKK